MKVSVLMLVVAIALGCGGAAPPTRLQPVRAPAEVGLLVEDDDAFAEFGARVRAATSDLFILAILDALANDWTRAVARLDELRAHEPDPDRALLTGMSIRIWADAHAHGGDTSSPRPEGSSHQLARGGEASAEIRGLRSPRGRAEIAAEP